jgi:hypothetical protein
MIVLGAFSSASLWAFALALDEKKYVKDANMKGGTFPKHGTSTYFYIRAMKVTT